MLRKHAARVCHVHCKDVRPGVVKLAYNRQWSFLTAVINGAFTVPGDGVVDFPALLAILRDHGYRGWLVVEAEQDPRSAPSYRYAKMGHDHLRLHRRRPPCAEGGMSPARASSPLLVKARTGRTIVEVTPASAGWRYVGFAAYRLKAGETLDVQVPGAESCVVVLSGRVTRARPSTRGATSARARACSTTSRRSRSTRRRPSACRSSRTRTPRSAWRAQPAGRGIRAAADRAGHDEALGARQGSNQRFVCDILPQTEPAAHLLVVEVRHALGTFVELSAAQARPRQPAARELARGDVLPPAESAAGIRVPARLHRRPLARRSGRRRGPRRGDGAARLPSRRGAARLRVVLPERDGGTDSRMAFPQRSGARVDARRAGRAGAAGAQDGRKKA
jgi:hypothetical protein